MNNSLLEYQMTKINNKNAKINLKIKKIQKYIYLLIDTNQGLCVVLEVPNPQN